MDRNGTSTAKAVNPPKNYAGIVCGTCGETVRAYPPNHLQKFALRKVMNGHISRAYKAADPPKILEETARTPVENGQRSFTMATEVANQQKLFVDRNYGTR